MTVVDGGIGRNGLIILRKSASGETGTESVVLGAGEIQEGIVGVKQSDAIGHRGLLPKGMQQDHGT
jgi:hypothetical protein